MATDAGRLWIVFTDFFEGLLTAELDAKQQRTRAIIQQTAGFSVIKTLEQFDVLCSLSMRLAITHWRENRPICFAK